MNKIEYNRKKIDIIDKKTAKLLLLRFNLVKQISDYKKNNKIKVIDKKRELQVIKNIKRYSGRRHKKFITNIFKSVINYSKELQK